MSVGEKFVYTACMGTGCHEGCCLKTFVDDGKIVRTEQAILGPPEGLRYGICQKGIEYAKFPYLPPRLLYPLKGVGERGEGKIPTDIVGTGNAGDRSQAAGDSR